MTQCNLSCLQFSNSCLPSQGQAALIQTNRYAHANTIAVPKPLHNIAALWSLAAPNRLLVTSLQHVREGNFGVGVFSLSALLSQMRTQGLCGCHGPDTQQHQVTWCIECLEICAVIGLLDFCA